MTKEDEECDGLSHYGSRGPEFGGESDLLYSQFELVTPERQMKQIVLLKVHVSFHISQVFLCVTVVCLSTSLAIWLSVCLSTRLFVVGQLILIIVLIRSAFAKSN